jgi:hypothetical protein
MEATSNAGVTQLAGESIRHDALDSFLQLSAGDTGCASYGRRQVELADFQDAFGVDLGFTAHPHHFFVAGALAFFFEARAQPPHQGMEPEDGFDGHVNDGKQVVAAADVAQFVRQDRFQLRVLQPVSDAGGKPEDWAENAEDAGLQFGGGGDEDWDRWQANRLPHLPERFQFPAFRQGRGRMDGGGDATPTRPSV